MKRGLLAVGVTWGLCGLTPPAAAQSREAEHFAVSVHARSTHATARAEQAAWLSVTVPLDRLAAPKLTALPVAPSASPAQPEPGSEGALAETPAVPPLGLEQLRALSEFGRRATGVALGAAGAASERRRLDSLATRARASAALPEVRLRAQRNTDQALRWAPTSDDPYRVTQADGAGTTLEASATFRLDRLLFSREELVVERLRQQAGAERIKLEDRVLTALLGLFRARQRACAASDEAARAEQLLRIAEHAAELDALTAGWFSAQAAELGRRVWGFAEASLGLCQPSKPSGPPEPAAPPPPTNPVASATESE